MSAVYASIGLVLRVRRADLVIGWLFLGIGVIAGLSNMTWGYVLLAAASGADPGPFAAANLAWIANALQVPAWFALATALVLLFPDGRLPGPAWRPVLIGVFLATGALSLGLALAPGPLQFFPFMQNPHAASGLLGDLALVATVVALAVLAVLAVASAWSMVLRYRHGSSVQRQQLKWFAWASTLAVAAGLLEIVMAGAWFPVASGAADASWLLFTAAVVTVPAAALVAILRYRLYDIDRLIGRTFVYGSLTAILAGLYAASIRLFTAAFVAFTGQSSDGALVLSTLVLATTFTPIKGRLETVARERLHDPGRPGTAVAPVEGVSPGGGRRPGSADGSHRAPGESRSGGLGAVEARGSEPGVERGQRASGVLRLSVPRPPVVAPVPHPSPRTARGGGSSRLRADPCHS